MTKLCTCHFRAPEFCVVHKVVHKAKTAKTAEEIFAESAARFKVTEKPEGQTMKEKILGYTIVLLAVLGAFPIALLPAWATILSTNRLGFTAYDINLGTVCATAWLMSCAGFVLWRLKGGK